MGNISGVDHSMGTYLDAYWVGFGCTPPSHFITWTLKCGPDYGRFNRGRWEVPCRPRGRGEILYVEFRVPEKGNCRSRASGSAFKV